MKYIAKLVKGEEQKDVMISDCILVDLAYMPNNYDDFYKLSQTIEKCTGFKNMMVVAHNRYLIFVRPANHVREVQ